MSERLKDRGANVTGAARGIGQAVALPMASEGAAVSLGDLDEAGVKETARQVIKEGGRAVSVRCDAGDRTAVDALVERLGHRARTLCIVPIPV